MARAGRETAPRQPPVRRAEARGWPTDAGEVIRVAPSWLALREPADAAARSRELAAQIERALPVGVTTVVHDLGGGTGSMGRWLAPLLSGPQHWVVHDRDEALLALAAADPPAPRTVTVETRRTDLAGIDAGDLAGADLVTASALLDILTAAEVERLVGVCVEVGCPVLLTLSVIGEVSIAPADPLDRRVAAAFDAHQRRATDRGPLLGPDAVDFAAGAFRRHGLEAVVRPSPWRLGPEQVALAAEWFEGWVGAALEQDPALAEEAEPYARRRLAEARAGELTVSVGHADLLVLP
jgi:hypothetical protein